MNDNDWFKKQVKKIDRQEKVWNIVKYPLAVLFVLFDIAIAIDIPVAIVWLCWNFIIK